MQKYANLVELKKCCQTHIFLQIFVLIQLRTSPPKICKKSAKNLQLFANFVHQQILLARWPADLRGGAILLRRRELVAERQQSSSHHLGSKERIQTGQKYDRINLMATDMCTGIVQPWKFNRRSFTMHIRWWLIHVRNDSWTCFEILSIVANRC